jgi:hypothetical protein
MGFKKYLAIGHFKGQKNATLSVAWAARSIADFRATLYGNEFVPYCIISMKKLETLGNISDNYTLFEEVQKLTTDYRRWNLITDYIAQCWDIMQERLAKVELPD